MSEDISPLPVHVPPAARSRWLAQGYEYHECQALQTPLFAARDGGRREPSSDMKGSMTRSHQTKLPAVSWPQRPLPAHRASQSYRKTGSSEYENMEGPKESTPSSSLRQKNACEDHIDPPQQAQANSKDPEKTSGEYSDGRHHGYDRQSSALHSTVPYEGDDQDFEDGAEKHSIWILVYLSLLAPCLALLFSIYTIIAFTAIVLCIPFCLFCSDCRPFRSQLHFFLSSPLAFQLGLIYSEKSVSDMPGNQPAMLIVINVCSPFYALWISTSACVAAAFWVFTTVMGNPDGQDGKDDGRDAVMSVRRWWERWLEKALR